MCGLKPRGATTLRGNDYCWLQPSRRRRAAQPADPVRRRAAAHRFVYFLFLTEVLPTLAVKSAAAVAARVARLFRATPHTAPLWPSKVPIQSPVSPCRSIGFPSTKTHNPLEKISVVYKHKHRCESCGL